MVENVNLLDNCTLMKKTTPKQKNPLLNLKKIQFQEGADLALENAENLLKIAKSCHQMGLSGNGTSILITSLEELSKASYLKIKEQNPEIVVKELEGFFRSHKVKHQAIIRLYTKSVTNNLKALPKEHQCVGGFVIIGVLLVLAVIAEKNGFSLKLDLEKIRQRGYYVNFKNDETRWLSPKDLIGPDGFGDFIEIVEHVFTNVKKDLFHGQLTDINTKEYINELGDENVFFDEVNKSNRK